MPNKYVTCSSAFSDNNKLVSCDSCHGTVYAIKRCTLTATEFQAKLIQTRTSLYFRKDWRTAFKRATAIITGGKVKQGC